MNIYRDHETHELILVSRKSETGDRKPNGDELRDALARFRAKEDAEIEQRKAGRLTVKRPNWPGMRRPLAERAEK